MALPHTHPMDYRTHTLDVYSAELYLATNRKQWRQLRRKNAALGLAKDPGAIGTADLILDDADTLNTPHLPVFINVAAHADDIDALVNTCAHEAAHVATLLLDHIGQPATGEAHAYLVGWVTTWLFSGCT